MSLFFSVAFFVFAGVVLRGRTQVYNYVQGECSNPIGIFGDYDRIHQIAEYYMCSS
jgi:hypothetical protein